MPAKTEQLQIRVSPPQKAALKRLARAAGRDVSSYVLSRLVPEGASRMASIVKAIDTAVDHRYALAELHDFLHACPAAQFADAVGAADVNKLTPYLRNYVAAMVEQAADQKRVAPPPWVNDVVPLTAPTFATPLKSVRMHLLAASPVPFKRRNIFVDTGVGGRV